MKTLTFAYSTNSCVIPTPKWGYETEIVMAFKVSKSKYNGYPNTWDNGTSYDYRTCDATWLLSSTEMSNLSSFLENVNGGRNNEFVINIDDGSGFYAFGPDYDGNDEYTVVEISNKRSGRLLRPYNKFEFSCRLLMAFTANSGLTTEVDEGDLQIGTIDGLPFIKNIDINYVKGWECDISLGGTPLYVDRGIESAHNDSQITFELNQSKAAALINHIVTNIRDNEFNIIVPSGMFLFGAKNGDSGTYTCKLNNNKIRISHGTFDRFMITLDIHLVGIVS